MPRTGLVPCLSIFYCEFAGAGDVGEGQSRALVIVGSDFEPWILQILGAILGCRYIVDESDTSIIQCAMKKKRRKRGISLDHYALPLQGLSPASMGRKEI